MKSFIFVAALFAFSPSVDFADEPLPGGKYTLTGVEVKPIERTKTDDGKINDEVSDKLTYWIRLDVHPTYTVERSPSFSITNPTVASKTKLTLDKPVKFKGKAVPAGTNLLEFKKFDGSFFNVHVPELTPLAIHSATIKSGFEIPADTYVVKFEWSTAKGETISDTVKVFIDVDLPALQ